MTTEPTTVSHRLPRHTEPSRYDVELRPDLDAATFTGSVRIAVTTNTATPVLELNAIDLSIEQCRLDGVPVQFELDESAERLVLRPDQDVNVGDHHVEITFAGTLNDKLRGWYRSTYTDADGNEQVIATSQMESTDCRRAFPCWDEPDFKAVFGLTLVVAPDLLAVSNGREIERTERDDGLVAIRFADTMVMSSYLVAMVVGPLVATDWVDVDGTPVRIVHVPGKEHLTDFGLDIAAFSLRWFQSYYGIDYPSDKVDLLALPDFAAGAMENLGCITFRENMLLVDPDTATQHERQLVADVVAHELAHMWFGDLVTMRWWNGLWLNEAFATFMEVAAVAAYRPDWQRWTSFGLERSAAFEVDALTSTRSVEFEVRSPADAEGMFDVLTYQKGGALLRMLEQYLGEEQFRQGVAHYLRAHAYANTETHDLWDALEATSGEPVRRIMDSWIWQPGFPVVNARVEDGEIVLTQERFLYAETTNAAGDESSAAASETRWAIPVAVADGSATTRYLLDGDELRIDDPGTPVVVNAGGHGFFRVAYADELRQRLSAEVVSSLTTLERYTLVDDAASAMVAGSLHPIEYLDLVERFAAEREYGVWQSIALGLRAVRRLLEPGSAADEAFQHRVAHLVRPALDDLAEPVDGEADLVSKLRGLLLSLLAVHGGDDAAIERARAIYAAWVDDPAGADAELAAAATGVVAAFGDHAVYDEFTERALHGATPQVQLRHLYSLAEFDDAELMARTCDLALSGQVRTQNAPFLLRQCIANRHHGRQAWEFVRRHWTELNESFPRNAIAPMIDTVRLLDQPADVDEVAAFFAEHPIEQATKSLAQILERQRVNARLRAATSASLADALGETAVD